MLLQLLRDCAGEEGRRHENVAQHGIMASNRSDVSIKYVKYEFKRVLSVVER